MKGLPERSGTLTGFSDVWSVTGVTSATVLTSNDGQPHGTLKVRVERGQVRAYLEYIAGYFVYCAAEAGRPCQVKGALIGGSRKSTSRGALRSSMLSGPKKWDAVLEGTAEGVRLEFTPN